MSTPILNYHPVLTKQLESLSATQLNDPSIISFIERINKTYTRLEKEKRLSEHAFEVTENEYQVVNKSLVKQMTVRTESIRKLKEVIQLFKDDTNFALSESEDDILNVIQFLKRQIKRSRILEKRLREAKNSAEKASTAKGDFLAVMSHEIRTPLNAINGLIHLLLLDRPASHQIENLKALDISAENLLSLINDILDFNKIEEGKIVFNPKSFNVRTFLNNIRLTYQQCAEERENRIEVNVSAGIPEVLLGDDLRLRQVLNNLVSNAIKFTKAGTITIQLDLIQLEGAKVEVEFSVSDTGIGIEKDKQAHVFERFAQANASTTREYGGTGLGLAISQKLLQLQGSDLALESEVGKGSTFSFSLIFDVDEMVNNQTEIKTTITDLEGAKILLVDDNAMNILFTKKLVHNWNSDVQVAVNGLEAVNKASAEDYDLILMDLHMPVMDGYTASTKIRQFNQTLPIIALTASIEMDVQEKIKQSGLNDFLQKPFKPNELYQIIRKHIDA
jgi:signal transduction histidine kinase/CheY-like chemotaxis protein